MENNTKLFLGAKKGNLDMVKDAFAKGADLEHENQYGNKALSIAAWNGHLNVVKFLIKNGAKINQIDKEGDTALIAAAAMGHLNVVKFLIENGADVEHENQYGNTALLLAAEYGYKNIFNILLSYRANFYHKNKNGDTALTVSNIQSKITKTFDKFLKNKNEVMIAKGNCYKQIIYLLKNNDDIICSSLQSEKLIINSLKLLQTKIEKIFKGQTHISSFWQKEVINSLVFDELNYSLLHIAVLNDWQELVTYLVKKWPVDIDYKDSSGNSAWNHACMLLKKEAAFQIKNFSQLTDENEIFLKTITISSPNWNTTEEGNYKIASKIRKEISNYYIIDSGIDALEFFQQNEGNKSWKEITNEEKTANALGFEKDKSKINSETSTIKSQSSSSKSQKM